MDTILKTEHIEIQEGICRDRVYYIIWYYEHHKMFGFNKAHDLHTALDMAIKYLEVQHGA